MYLEDVITILIVLAIVAAIVVIIVLVVKSNNRKKAKAFEDLKNSNAYALAVKIKDELEKQKGYKFGEPYFDWNEKAYGYFIKTFGGPTEIRSLHIAFSEYSMAFLNVKHNFRMKRAESGNRCYGIENDNIGILVTSTELTQDMPDYIKIAAKVIEDSGYGQCKLIQ
jgi:hypothetical protein